MTRSSRIPFWLALVGLAVAATSVIAQLGSAAALEVRVAAPLQVIEMDVDVDIPDPTPTDYDITVIVRRFSADDDPKEVGGSPDDKVVAVPAGHDYTISWSGGPTFDCATFGHDIPTGHVGAIDGTFTATAAVTHEVCIQNGKDQSGNGKISLQPLAPEGNG